MISSRDIVGKTYWYIRPDGKKDFVLVTSIENCNTISKRKEWAWVTDLSWIKNKDKILRGRAINYVNLFSEDASTIPGWDFELEEIK